MNRINLGDRITVEFAFSGIKSGIVIARRFRGEYTDADGHKHSAHHLYDSFLVEDTDTQDTFSCMAFQVRACNTSGPKTPQSAQDLIESRDRHHSKISGYDPR